MWFSVGLLGLRGSGFRVFPVGFEVSGIQGSGCRVPGLECRLPSSGFEDAV